jgi:bacillithiol biosynthesis deacetylase BshB1
MPSLSPVDILAIGAHPDDVELGCGGTLAKHVAAGDRVAILDLTRGEMGTRGTAELRDAEALEAAKILGVSQRVNAGMRDGFLENSEANQRLLIAYLRAFQPRIVLATAPRDRHPDHGHASQLIVDSCFKAGLQALATEWEGQPQSAHRPEHVYHYIQYYDLVPDFSVDITGFMDQKMASILAHTSQFFDANSQEPETLISSKGFLAGIEARSCEWGRAMYVTHAEGFLVERRPGVNLLTDLR